MPHFDINDWIALVASADTMDDLRSAARAWMEAHSGNGVDDEESFYGMPSALGESFSERGEQIRIAQLPDS